MSGTLRAKQSGKKSAKSTSAATRRSPKTAAKRAVNDEQKASTNVCVLRRIGTIHTPFVAPKGTPLGPSRADGARGTVWIQKPYRAALKDLDGFDRVWLLFWLHRAPRGKALVTPFLDVELRGQFATRTPARFNPIGLSSVRLLAVHEDRIEVGDVDMIDGTPLLDIKPYVAEFDSHPGSRQGWYAKSTKSTRVADARFMKKPSKRRR